MLQKEHCAADGLILIEEVLIEVLISTISTNTNWRSSLGIL